MRARARVCVCARVCLFACTCACVCAHEWLCVCVWVIVYVRVCECVHVRACVCECVRAHELVIVWVSRRRCEGLGALARTRARKDISVLHRATYNAFPGYSPGTTGVLLGLLGYSRGTHTGCSHGTWRASEGVCW